MSWALLESARFQDDYARLSSKFKSQISRKLHGLMENPKPGGSRTALVGYDGLFRVRAGDFRIIYTYIDSVVQALTVRRRSGATYDQLDDLEIQELSGFKSLERTPKPQYDIAAWERLAMQRIPARPEREGLPAAITEELLNRAGVPPEFRQRLMSVRSVEELLDCDDVPDEWREATVEQLCPRETSIADEEPEAIVVIGDMLDPAAQMSTGPIDAAQPENPEQEEAEVRRRTVVPETTGLPAVVRVPAPMVVVSSRRQTPMQPYRGNTARGIAQDTSYSVKLDGSVRLIYNVGHNERALLTTDEHPELVDMVNEAKQKGGASQGGGRFVINEYRHVIVPTQNGQVLFAGVYTPDLEFEFDNHLISPVAPKGINPGDVWPGPHVGVRYTLAANASDVRYEEETSRGTLKRVCLTDYFSTSELGSLLQMFRATKPQGGAVYVNEARELFAPVDAGSGYKRLYIGHLGKRPWFPDPT